MCKFGGVIQDHTPFMSCHLRSSRLSFMGVTLEQTASTSAWLLSSVCELFPIILQKLRVKDVANQSDAVGIQMNFIKHCRKAEEQRFKGNGSETRLFVYNTVSLEGSNNTQSHSFTWSIMILRRIEMVHFEILT